MRRWMSLALAAVLLFTVTGCGSGREAEPAARHVVVGFSQLGAESSWRIANTESMVSAADS